MIRKGSAVWPAAAWKQPIGEGRVVQRWVTEHWMENNSNQGALNKHHNKSRTIWYQKWSDGNCSPIGTHAAEPIVITHTHNHLQELKLQHERCCLKSTLRQNCKLHLQPTITEGTAPLATSKHRPHCVFGLLHYSWRQLSTWQYVNTVQRVLRMHSDLNQVCFFCHWIPYTNTSFVHYRISLTYPKN